ncbi:hypothetical protein [Streptomyces sp. NPDC001621]|uniref:hypothetical protein n=1 Tax=Streptomyces sp. NPDC001621 TaxID=3364594 RepID=UPI003696404C
MRATLAAVQAERAATRDQTAAAAPTLEAPPAHTEPTATAAGTGTPQDAEESRTSEVTDSRTPAPEEPQPEPTSASGTETPASAPPVDDDGPALDAVVDGIRRALDDALQGSQPEVTVQPGELPLWTGTEASPVDGAATEPSTGALDVRAEFQPVMDAWTEHVPPANGTAQDLVADLDADLTALQRAFAEAVTPQPTVPDQAATAAAAPAATTAPVNEPASAVNAGLQQADRHAVALQDLPEWQQIQTVRGAVGHLFRVMKERAGEAFDRLMGDNRVGEFFRKVSIRACEKVAHWAQAGADYLRRRGGKKEVDAPAADALRGLAEAATAYSTPGGSRSGPPPASRGSSSSAVDIPAMRSMGEALARPLPGTAEGRRVSSAAARGRSTTRRGTKKPGGATEQAGHLRHGGPEQQGRKPHQR